MYFLKSSIIPCKGYTKTILIDIIKSEILLFNDNKYCDELYELYHNGVIDIDNRLLKVLKENNYILSEDSISNFPRLSFNEDLTSTFLIDNIIIDRNKNSNYDLVNILQQLDYLHCKHIQFRFYDYSDDIFKAIDFLNKKESFIQYVEVIIKYSKSISILKDLFKKNLRINRLIVFDCPYEESNSTPDGRVFLMIKENIKNCKFCGKISMVNFHINKYHVKESHQVNTCLYKKVGIDVNGIIKNCPSMQEKYGNVDEIPLISVIKQSSFKKQWIITKDVIQVCKDCEYRYLCMDCRAYTEINDSRIDNKIYPKPLKCGYNPYKGEWIDWRTDKVKMIKHYGLDELLELK